MKRTIFAGMLMGLSLTIVGFSQTPPAVKTGNMELLLQPEDLRNGVPQAFTFVFTNTTDHDLHVPMPAIACDDSYFGAVQLELRFVSLKPGYLGDGNGCSLGYGGMQDILDRAKTWKVLHAGESLSLHAKKKKLLYTTKLAGTYEFWAEYTPAELSPTDKQKLKEAGIEYPQQKLSSTRLTFKKMP